MQPYERMIHLTHADLCVYEWGTPASGKPSVIFFHATGFHGRCWDETIRHLQGVHIFAVDAFGHGKSSKHPIPHTWQQFGADAAELVRALELKGAVGVGHSMGGNSLTRSAAALPNAFRALMLIEPVIAPPEHYNQDSYTIEGHYILKRRTRWDSPQQMQERFGERPPFSRWNLNVLRDYCLYGLLPEGDQFRLACDPALEAHIYSSYHLKAYGDIYDAIAQVSIPVHVLRSDTGMVGSTNDLSRSPTDPQLASHFANGHDEKFAEYSHFLPMEAPELVARRVRELLEAYV